MSDFHFVKIHSDVGGIAVHRDIKELVHYKGQITIDIGKLPSTVYNSVCNAIERGWSTNNTGKEAGILRLLTQDRVPISYVGISRFCLLLPKEMAERAKQELIAFAAMSDGMWGKYVRLTDGEYGWKRVHCPTYGGGRQSLSRTMLADWHKSTWDARAPLLDHVRSKPVLTYNMEG